MEKGNNHYGEPCFYNPKRGTYQPSKTQTTPTCPFCGDVEDIVHDYGLGKIKNNKFPYIDYCEVIIESKEHKTQFQKTTQDEANALFTTIQKRLKKIQEQGLYAVWHRNEGPQSGGSVPHIHSQIVGTTIPVPRKYDKQPKGTIITETENFKAIVPETRAYDYELHITPKKAKQFSELNETELNEIATLFRQASIGAAQLGKDASWNAFINENHETFQIEIVPRNKIVWGFELLTGYRVCTNSPTETILAWQNAFENPAD